MLFRSHQMRLDNTSKNTLRFIRTATAGWALRGHSKRFAVSNDIPDTSFPGILFKSTIHVSSVSHILVEYVVKKFTVRFNAIFRVFFPVFWCIILSKRMLWERGVSSGFPQRMREAVFSACIQKCIFVGM